MKEAHSFESARVINWLSKRGTASPSKSPLTCNQRALRAYKGVVPKIRVELIRVAPLVFESDAGRFTLSLPVPNSPVS